MSRRRGAALLTCALACSSIAISPAPASTHGVAQAVRAQGYSKAPTVSCLREKQVAVAAVRPADRRLRALRDLAQKTSWQASKGKLVVGVSIGRNESEAELLVELLRVPNTPYRLEQRSNAVLVYLPPAASLAKKVRACLA